MSPLLGRRGAAVLAWSLALVSLFLLVLSLGARSADVAAGALLPGGLWPWALFLLLVLGSVVAWDAAASPLHADPSLSGDTHDRQPRSPAPRRR